MLKIGTRNKAENLKFKLILLGTLNLNEISSAQLMGRVGEGLPCPFLKIEKKSPNFGKKALIVSILGLNLPFKSVPAGLFFFPCFWRKVYQSALTSQNLLCPEKFLVASLNILMLSLKHLSIYNIYWRIIVSHGVSQIVISNLCLNCSSNLSV